MNEQVLGIDDEESTPTEVERMSDLGDAIRETKHWAPIPQWRDNDWEWGWG